MTGMLWSGMLSAKGKPAFQFGSLQKTRVEKQQNYRIAWTNTCFLQKRGVNVIPTLPKSHRDLNFVLCANPQQVQPLKWQNLLEVYAS